MNTKALYAAIAVIILVIAGLFLYNQSRDNDNSNTLSNQNEVSNLNTETNLNGNSNTNANTNTSNANTPANNNSGGQFSGEGDIAGKTYQISYDGTKFTPSTMTINAGDTIVFKNASSKSFWPASAPHPQHTNYPEFDAKKAIAAGGNFTFIFTKAGTWGFHDHLNPSAFGSITVK